MGRAGGRTPVNGDAQGVRHRLGAGPGVSTRIPPLKDIKELFRADVDDVAPAVRGLT